MNGFNDGLLNNQQHQKKKQVILSHTQMDNPIQVFYSLNLFLFRFVIGEHYHY